MLRNPEHPSVDDQVEDLRERMRLLQGDRKANIDILEANKTANKDDIKRFRDESKDLRLKLSQLQKGATQGEDGAEEDHLQREVNKMRKQYDDHRSKTSGLKRELDLLKDEVKDLELEARQPNREDTPLTRKVRMLENRLDKAMIKFNEAQSIRKTYEQIVKRLKEERVGFDNQLGALERTLQAKQKDYEELQLLSGDANHAREVAAQELEKVRYSYEEERKRREGELREKHQVVQLRRQMRDRADKRERMKQEIIAEEMGEDGEASMKKAMAISSMTSGKMATDRLEHKSRIDVFENAFRKIKEATGVSDVNEVIQKIVSQEGTAENLMLLTKENQARIEQLNRQKNELKSRVEEVKYSGPGEGHRRKMVDDHEEQLGNSLARLERVKQKYERLAKVLIGVKAGIEHLQDKLKSIAEEVAVEPVVMTDETVVDVLEASENILVEVANRLKIAEYEAQGLDPPPRGLGKENTMPRGGSTEDITDELQQSRPFNQRIDLPSVDGSSDGEASRDDDIHDLDEDELTRDKVKKAANQVLLAQEKKKKKPKRTKGREYDE